MTFKEYLAGQVPKYNAKGDFLRVAKADADLPDFATLEELTAYIERRHGFSLVEAGRAVWMDFKSNKSKKSGRLARDVYEDEGFS